MRFSKMLYRRVFPSHVSWKEAVRYFLGLAGLDVRLLSRARVKGISQLGDIRVIVGSKPAPVFFDVGAHVGESLYKMRNLYPGAHIHSFEPSPKAFSILKSEWGTTEGIELNASALGDTEGTAAFNEFEGGGSPANSILSIDRSSPSVVQRAPLTERIQVPVETVDGYCRRKTIRHIDWLKVDAQGYDLNVLRGATSLLEAGAIGVVSMEVNLMPMYEGEATLCDMIEFCARYRYFLLGFYETSFVGNRLSCGDVCFARFA